MGRTIREQLGARPAEFTAGQGLGAAIQSGGAYFGQVALEQKNAQALEDSRAFQVEREEDAQAQSNEQQEARFDESEAAAIRAEERKIATEKRLELYRVAGEDRAEGKQMSTENRAFARQLLSEARDAERELTREERLLETQINAEDRANDTFKLRSVFSNDLTDGDALQADELRRSAEDRANIEKRSMSNFTDVINDGNRATQNIYDRASRLEQNGFRVDAAALAEKNADENATLGYNRTLGRDAVNNGYNQDAVALATSNRQDAASLSYNRQLGRDAVNNGYSQDAAEQANDNANNRIQRPLTRVLGDIPLMQRPESMRELPDVTRVQVRETLDGELLEVIGTDPDYMTDPNSGKYGRADTGITSFKPTEGQIKFGIHGGNLRSGVTHLQNIIAPKSEGGLGYDLESGQAFFDQQVRRAGSIGNWITTTEGQQYYAARTRAGEALFKGESGAAGSDPEAERYYSMFPSPGDKPETRALKLELLEVSIKAFETAAQQGNSPEMSAKYARNAAEVASADRGFNINTGAMYGEEPSPVGLHGTDGLTDEDRAFINGP
jgi:hypothetical protein